MTLRGETGRLGESGVATPGVTSSVETSLPGSNDVSSGASALEPAVCHPPGMEDALRLLVEPRLEAPTLVLAFEGWNDAGESASGAVRYLDDALRTAPLGEIEGEAYYDFTVHRPSVKVSGPGGRRIEWPSYAFRFGEVSDRCALITGSGAEPHLRWRSFCGHLIALSRRMGVRRVLLLGAYLADVLYSLPIRVTGTGRSLEHLEDLALEASAYEGPTGIVGVLTERFREEGIEALSLWAGLPHYISVTPNPRGTLALVQKVARLLDLPVDQAPLERAAAEFETQVSRLVAEDPALAEYVRQLKRREFAQ